MQNYSSYTVNDFMLDEFFQSWIVTPDASTNSFWEQYLKDHPEKISDIQEAKSIIENLKFSSYDLAPGDVKELWDRINQS